MPKAISTTLFLFLLFLVGPAMAWEDGVVDTTATLMNGHCVNPNADNTVYLLSANSGDYMSDIEERQAMSALTMAFLEHGRFQVTRGAALKYEAYMSENTDAGRKKLKDAMARFSRSTITIFFVPVGRDRRYAYADVVFLARNNANGDAALACGPSITVEIPITAAQPPVSLESKAERFVVEYVALLEPPDGAFLSRVWSLFDEPVDFYNEKRTLQGIHDEKAAIAKRWPVREYNLLPDTLVISCDQPYCDVQAHYKWRVSSRDGKEQKSGRSTLTMTLRQDGQSFKIIAENGDVY